MTLASVGVLGPVQAWSTDGECLPLGPLRQHALLAVLALRANGPVDAETLIAAVWAGTPPASARNLLHTYVCRLRRIIDPEGSRWDRRGVLSRSDAGYLLKLPPGGLDLHRFDLLVARAGDFQRAGDLASARDLLDEASRLWRGEALQGIFSPVVENQRRRLEEQRMLVTTNRLALELELGQHQAAVPELFALATEHPLQEELTALLMVALYRSGRQSDALYAYATIRDLLAEELGVSPGRRLQDLHVNVLREDPGLGRRREPGPAHGNPTRAPEPHSGRGIGRAGESGDKAVRAETLRAHLSMAEARDDRPAQAVVLRDLGFLDWDDPTHDRIGYLERSRALCLQLRSQHLFGQVLYGLGRLYQQRGECARAWDEYRRAWAATAGDGGSMKETYA